MTRHDQESDAPDGPLSGGPSLAGPALNLLPAVSKASGDWPDLYEPLIGSWTVESSFVGPDGATQRANGQWHFERILGGMGVQDVLFAEGSQPERYGTSLRVVDPRSGLWHVVWMQPGAGEFVALVGRAEGDGIVHEGYPLDDPQGPRQRWSFTDISRTAFTWTGESSSDGGVSWSLEQTMLGTRKEHESG
jgi:hypothetical protein